MQQRQRLLYRRCVARCSSSYWCSSLRFPGSGRAVFESIDATLDFLAVATAAAPLEAGGDLRLAAALAVAFASVSVAAASALTMGVATAATMLFAAPALPAPAVE